MIQYFLPKNVAPFTIVNAKVLLALLIFSSIFCTFSSFLDYGDDTPFLLIGILNAGLVILYALTKSRILIGNLFLLVWCFFLAKMSLETGGIYSMDAFYLVLAPLVAYCLLGQRSGNLWLLGVFCFSIFLWSLAASPEDNLYYKEMTKGFQKDYYLAAHVMFIVFFTGIFGLFSFHHKQLISKLKAQGEELNQSVVLLQEQSTQLEKSRGELKRSNQELEEYANATSHDLKQPIRNVNNFANLLHRHLSKQDKLDSRTEEMLGFIMEGSDRMLNLISDLLTFAKLKTETDRVFEEVSLNKIVEDVLFNLNSTVEKTGTTVQVHPLPTAVVIPIKLGQVFQNIMSNAIKFRKKEEPLTLQVSAVEMKECIKVTIQDNGIGIEKEFLEKIFVPFKKLHAQREYKGSGIGLATCKHIVALHQGDIWVESEYGKGSTFYFTLSKLLNTNLKKDRMLLSDSELN